MAGDQKDMETAGNITHELGFPGRKVKTAQK
jgi:hypothetical protein